MTCPICQTHCTEEKDPTTLKTLRRLGKYEEEQIWYCYRCRAYFYEEDFLYTTE